MNSETTNGSLEKIKLWTQIISSAAIPIAIALGGWLIQAAISDAGLKKDYVQMALSVLKEVPTKENEQLREWAISIIEKNAPVPIPSKLKGQLASMRLITLADINVQERIDCKKAKDKETVDWLIESFPEKFSRCENSNEIGIITFDWKNRADPQKEKRP
ncbi:MAG: hypothetical protein KIT07_05335 [Anaerolineales bacterium]|nr:hypothetical protein [Rhodocyclaceae bacterium]MCP5296221.1 hypothetical protein [Zoogloeaceae bacterium]MCW5887527.1 hypothetical protein [Anaerolineales bacterium]